MRKHIGNSFNFIAGAIQVLIRKFGVRAWLLLAPLSLSLPIFCRIWRQDCVNGIGGVIAP
jgi:hypothetical protein